jgi:hypothetical protein
LGTAGGVFSSAVLTVNSSSGGFNPSGVAPGTYTVNYTINITGCSPFQTTASVTIVTAPAVPTLLPANPCALNANTYTAGSGSWYEYFVGGVSTGPASSTNTFNPGVLAAGTQVCVRSYPAPSYVFDGAINEPQWGNPLATSAGGPASGFGSNYLDALYLNAGGGYLYGAIAGQTANNSNNRILLFIDCIAGGFNNLNDWSDRNNAPYFSVENLGINGGILFDPGFSPDYILCMNQANGTAFWDLYNMETNTNYYLGSDVSDGLISTNLLGYQANGSQGNLMQGFEFAVPLALLDNPSASIQTFAMLVNDPGQGNATTVSNQFLTPAATTNGNYGNAFIDFGEAPPNPISYGFPPLCYQEQCVTVLSSAIPVFTAPAAICAGQPAPVLPPSSSNSPPVIGTWSGPVSNQVSGTYTFTPGSGQCATQTTLNVQVNPVPITVGIFHD